MSHDLPIIILCGGAGSRLRPLTERLPKTLVPLSGKPMLRHILEYHLAKGRRHFILCLGYLGDRIREFIAEAGFPEASFAFSDLGEKASMLARIHAAIALTDAPRALIVYGDTLIDTDVPAMLAAHRKRDADLTLTTASIRNPFGLVRLDADHRVLAFEEKPVQTYYIGQMLLERRVAEGATAELLERPDGEGLVRRIQDLAAMGRVGAFQYAGPQITFNTEQELQKAERDIITFYTQAF